MRALVLAIFWMTMLNSTTHAQETLDFSFDESGRALVYGVQINDRNLYVFDDVNANVMPDVLQALGRNYTSRNAIDIEFVHFVTLETIDVNNEQKKMIAVGEWTELIGVLPVFTQAAGDQESVTAGYFSLTDLMEQAGSVATNVLIDSLEFGQGGQTSLCDMGDAQCFELSKDSVDVTAAALSSEIERRDLEAGVQCVACCALQSSCCDWCSLERQ